MLKVTLGFGGGGTSTLLSPQLYNSRYIHLPVCNRLTTDRITVGP